MTACNSHTTAVIQVMISVYKKQTRRINSFFLSTHSNPISMNGAVYMFYVQMATSFLLAIPKAFHNTSHLQMHQIILSDILKTTTMLEGMVICIVHLSY